MNRLTASIICVASYLLITLTSDYIGVSMHQRGEEYYFRAATNLISLSLSPFLITFLLIYKPKGIREITSTIVPLWMRLCAFIVDFHAALLSTAALLALPAILAEWHHTDIMAWQFTREFSRTTDGVIVSASTLPGLAWLLFYFSYPLTKGRQTIGQYIMGYRIALKGHASVPIKKAILRTVLSFLVLCLGWLSVPLAFFNNQKHMLHDNAGGLRPELVTYKNS